VHDAARPLLSNDVIERVLAPLSEGWDGVVPEIPVPDTLKRVGSDGAVEETVARELAPKTWSTMTRSRHTASGQTPTRRPSTTTGSRHTDCPRTQTTRPSTTARANLASSPPTRTRTPRA
jgi:hypothetical protein